MRFSSSINLIFLYSCTGPKSAKLIGTLTAKCIFVLRRQRWLKTISLERQAGAV